MCVLAGSSCINTGAGGGVGGRSGVVGGSQNPPPTGMCRILEEVAKSPGFEG